MTTKIEWTDEVWNPTRGCRRVSPGCEHCYAEGQANRFKGNGLPYEGLVELTKKGPRWTGKGKFATDVLDAPLHWKKPRRIFVNSMSDLFFEKFSNEEIAAVFGVMAACPQHTFQVLTKRAKRMREWFEWYEELAESYGYSWERWRLCEQEAMEHIADLPATATGAPWPLTNVWLGVSVESQEYADERLPYLIETPAAVRFVSYEPALGPVSFQRFIGPIVRDRAQPSMPVEPRPIDWIIVGGESGPRARPFKIEWARRTIDQCKAAGVKCFVKQMGKWIVGSHEGFTAPMRWMCGRRDAWYEYAPPIVGPMKFVAPRDAIGFSLGGKGGDWSMWPEDLRVREFPS